MLLYQLSCANCGTNFDVDREKRALAESLPLNVVVYEEMLVFSFSDYSMTSKFASFDK